MTTLCNRRFKIWDIIVKTYRLRNDETGEDIPNAVERRRDNGGDVVVGCDGDRHHPIQGEIEQCEVCEENVPKELNHGPLESNHGIHQHSIYKCLNKDVGQFNHNLHCIIKISYIRIREGHSC